MKRDVIQNEYMYDTAVENMFINEFMISAPGDFVKVYLVALMYADLGKDIENSQLAKILGMTEDDILRAWRYWEELDVVRNEKGEKVFVSLKEKMYGRKKKDKDDSGERDAVKQESLSILENTSIRDLFREIELTIHRPVTGTEMDSILQWIDEIGASPEIIAFAFAHCYSKKKVNIRYIGRVVEGWTGRGFRTRTQAEEFLQQVDQRHYMYKRICKALGFLRNPTEKEKEIMDRWFDEEGFSMDAVLKACEKTSGISNPNFNYVNSVLTGQKKESGKGQSGEGRTASRKQVMDYYEYIRRKAEDEAKDRHEEIISGIPEIDALEKQIRENFSDITMLAISGTADKRERIAGLKDENSRLEKKIKRLLTERGIPADYMDVHYRCPICRDTGTLEDGQPCSCYIQRAQEAAEWR